MYQGQRTVINQQEVSSNGFPSLLPRFPSYLSQKPVISLCLYINDQGLNNLTMENWIKEGNK